MAPPKPDWEESTDAGQAVADGEAEPVEDDDVDDFPGGATRISAPPTAPPHEAAAPRATSPVAPAPVRPARPGPPAAPSGSPGAEQRLSKLKSLSLGGSAAPLPAPRPTAAGPSWIGRAIRLGLVAALGAGGFLAWPKLRTLIPSASTGGGARPHMRFLIVTKTARPAASLTAAGYISAEAFTIGTTVSGRVEKVLVSEGQEVKKKQVLIQLDDSQIRADMRLAAQKASSACGIYGHLTKLAKAGAALPLEVAKARGECEASRAEVGTYGPKVQQMKIVAPVDATVVEVLAHAGETLTAGGTTGIIRLADLNRPLVEADVNESDVPSLHVGQKVEATVDSFPDVVFPGSLKTIATEADRTKGTFKVTVTLQPDKRLRTNMSAKLRFQADEAPTPKLLIPKEAVKDGAVWVLVDGRARRRPLKTAPGGVDAVEVTNGLNPGERIIVSGYEGVAEGDAITITNE